MYVGCYSSWISVYLYTTLLSCRLPGLIESVLHLRPMGGPGLQLYIVAYNTIFIFMFASVAYAVASCMAGRNARLPVVAEAADAQVR